MKEEMKALIIEKLGQLERGELENCPAAKKLTEGFSKNPEFVKIYEDSKN